MDKLKQSSIQYLSLFLLQPRVIMRVIFIYAYFSFLFLLMGLAFWLIFSGIFMCIFKLASYWEPAYRLTAKIIGVQNINKVFTPERNPWYLLLLQGLSLGARAFMIGAGIWLLLQMGFLH